MFGNWFYCIVVVINNLLERRLSLHETFLTDNIPENVASAGFMAAALRLRHLREVLQR
jgi:hypothetical protein